MLRASRSTKHVGLARCAGADGSDGMREHVVAVRARALTFPAVQRSVATSEPTATASDATDREKVCDSLSIGFNDNYGKCTG